MTQEYNIPEGYEARIEGNKVIIAQRESKDERIRKHIIEILKRLMPCHFDGNERSECIAWLEKQKEQNPTPDWMPKFLDELRSKKNYFDWDEHRDIEGNILAIINWIEPNYFKQKEKEQKPFIICDTGCSKRGTKMPEYCLDVKPEEWSEEEKEKIVFEKIKSLGYPIDANGNYATCEELFESAKIGLSHWLMEQIPRLEMRKDISLSSNGVKTERLIKENYLQAYREGINDITNLLSEATPSLSKCSLRKPSEWSEEDDDMFYEVLYVLGQHYCKEHSVWLQNLKNRIKRR